VFPAGSRGLFAASKVVTSFIYNKCLRLLIHLTFTMVSRILNALLVGRKEQFCCSRNCLLCSFCCKNLERSPPHLVSVIWDSKLGKSFILLDN